MFGRSPRLSSCFKFLISFHIGIRRELLTIVRLEQLNTLGAVAGAEGEDLVNL